VQIVGVRILFHIYWISLVKRKQSEGSNHLTMDGKKGDP
jgi:hypothetical protein